ncbi:response regulator transcription factor [Paraburkholderia lycopersici]|uniref:Response regulator receiver domain-containing protein n=1 Tax=Paraburkholderia lycopersici TaxID=416944 RepID=A0A1G6HG20_9BURK|nr:response regulator [Paraburkholderia lycopersici]SDB93199.1 Response regulator receiver domain-containing protein [Paraburkholderia lycopersici]
MNNVTRSVAVVDDEVSVGRAIQRLLRSAGIDSDVFTSGEAFLDALAAAGPHAPSCVVLDIQMPGINGIEVQRRLGGSGIQCIVTTAHDDARVREQAQAAGAVAYLRKPFDGSALIGAVREVLDMPPTA